MKNGVDVRRKVAVVVEKLLEHIGFEVVLEAQGDEVLPFLGTVETIGDQDVFETAAVQLPNKGAADQPCAAGNDHAAYCQITHADHLAI